MAPTALLLAARPFQLKSRLGRDAPPVLYWVEDAWWQHPWRGRLLAAVGAHCNLVWVIGGPSEPPSRLAPSSIPAFACLVLAQSASCLVALTASCSIKQLGLGLDDQTARAEVVMTFNVSNFFFFMRVASYRPTWHDRLNARCGCASILELPSRRLGSR